MSERGNFKASEAMHGYENLTGLSLYKYSSVITEENSQMHGGSEKEIPFVTEHKQNEVLNFKDCQESDSFKKDTGNSLIVSVIIENKGYREEPLDSDAEESPTENSRHALEVDSHSNSADKQALCDHLPEMGADLSCKDKKKRRKKRKGPNKNPSQIFAFKEEEQKKIELSKPSLDTKKAVMCRTLSKSATFPGSAQDASSIEDAPILEVEKIESATENGHRCECRCSDGKNSFYTQTLSFPPSLRLIPAIRGGHEKNGLGPRPKFCVKWAPDVHEPPCSSVSHTVRNYHLYQSKKKYNKCKQKGKSSPRTASVKNEKQLMHNSNCNSEGDYSRLQSSSTQNDGNRMLSDALPSRALGLMPDESRLTSLNLQMGQNGIPLYAAEMHSDESHENEKNDLEGKCIDDLLLVGNSNFPSSSEAEFPFSQDSKCCTSFLRTIENKQLSIAEATR
ncbi:uncharacterized protein LOC131071283 [Cryptomeria japonica]|uniref:uncharacterized protein LOC131071283 n=1 Tax=Cryptomeria japonica TaxID=3369 RepID=UPI0027DAA16B|nr:uncharacterized protein LOC131071283 [Cryptomeria japonica]